MNAAGAAAGGRAWVAVAALLALAAAAAAGGSIDAALLDWQPALAWRQPWRAWSAAFVHLSTWHLAANLAGCVVVGALGFVARAPRRSVLAWLVTWPLTQFGLLARPDLLHYGGLSGVLHAGVAIVGLHLAVAAQGRRRAIGAALLAGTAIKVIGESPWGAAVIHPAAWDIAVAPFGHASGLVAGVLVAAASELGARWRARAGRDPAEATRPRFP